MNILVIGTGYVGTTTALVLADMGWNVTGLDTDHAKIKMLQQGLLPIYEDGLEALLVKHLPAGKIRFTTNQEEAIKDNDMIFICVGTPSLQDGNADLQYVKQVAENIGRHMNRYKLIVNKSTVPVGTQEKVTSWISESQASPLPYDVASNPEFLREGKALSDALHPDRIIIGTNSLRAAKLLKVLYQSMSCPIMMTTPKTAELIKYAANGFLATKISYINELAKLSDQLGINVKDVAQGIGLDSRIGLSFLQAGIGYGGSCFSKDVAALLRTANAHSTQLHLLEKVVIINQSQPLHLIEKLRKQLGSLMNKKIAILGIAFKPDTDDTRDSAALRIIPSLLSEGALIRVHDPAAKLPPELAHSSTITCSTPELALQDAEAVILCTEWSTYLQLDWERLKSVMRLPNLFDGRNVLDAEAMKAIGYHYEGVGYR